MKLSSLFVLVLSSFLVSNWVMAVECTSNNQCISPTEYCEKPIGQCNDTSLGNCVDKPGFCIALYDPVCGCDNLTYGNSCEAARAGVNVAYTGTCSSIDLDGDGYDSGVDCNDMDPAINPAAAEICDDAIDNNCNGHIDAQDPACDAIICTDNDGDGYSQEGGDCGPIDCNDEETTINPAACDIKKDGIDQDCSGKDRLTGKRCKAFK